jgi:RecA-family ATPase
VTQQPLAPDLLEAARFLDLMAEGEDVAFQTFDDNGARNTLAAIRHGGLDEHADMLQKLNASGAGIFWMVNAGNGQGRRAENVTAVRAVFVDLDGAPLQPVLAAGAEPHAIIESSPGRWHAYWLVSDCKLAQFGPVQRAPAARFNGDRKVHDLPRVMRLPGFIHRKAAPFRSRIESLQQFAPYALGDLMQRLALDLTQGHAAEVDPETGEIRGRIAPGQAIPDGKRNDQLFRIACQMRAGGFGKAAIEAALQAENAERCQPPLSAAEVKAIAQSAARYERGTQPDLSEEVLLAGAKGPGLGPLDVVRVSDLQDLGGQPVEWVEDLRNWQPTYDLATLEVQPNWAVRDWVLAGKVGALVAGGGTGKTTLLLYLFVCIAIGRPFMGCDVTPGSTVLLTNDDPQEDMEGVLALICRAMRLTAEEFDLVRQRVRLKSLQGVAGLKTFTRSEAGTVVDTGFQSLILQAVEEIPDLVGIALDTLRQFSGGASNDEEVIKMTVGLATEVALKTGAFVLLPHHTGKENYREGISDQYAGSGSAALGDNCRFVLVLQKAKWSDVEEKMKRTGREAGDPLVLTSTRGSLLARPPAPMYLYRDGYLLGRVAGSLRTMDQLADEKDRAILCAVRQGAQTKNAIYAVVKGKKAATLMRIDELEGRGHLVRSSQSGSPLLMVSTTGARFLEASE